MNVMIVVAAGVLCVAGILLMLSPAILKWQQDRSGHRSNYTTVIVRLPDWIGNVGLAMVGASMLLSFAPFL